MLIDTHAHLMDSQFDDDLEEVLLRAQKSGVTRIINVGCGLDFSDKSLEMSEKYDFLYATIGLHPYDAGDCSDALMGKWKGLIKENKKIVAVGETGLDYVKAKVSAEVQKESFRKHLELARETSLPVIVHNRDANADVLATLQEFPEVEAVFHCYGSNLEFAKQIWSAGYTTSFTGIITFPNASELREVVKAVPMDKFFLETDCPYLAPQSYRGERNEPSYVVEIAKKVAELKRLTFEEIAETSTKNVEAFFKRISVKKLGKLT